MAYNPNLYMPWNPTQPVAQPQFSQSVNGLVFIDDLSVLETLKMPPGSVSQPYFLKNEDKFAVVTFDNVGGSTTELYSFSKIPMPTQQPQGEFVTREYFDQQMNNIMEAINGKHTVSEATASKQQQQPSQSA